MQSRSRPFRRSAAFGPVTVSALALAALLYGWPASATAMQRGAAGARLLDQEPYDQITLSDQHQNEVLRVFPLSDTTPDSAGRVKVRLIDDEETEYEIDRRDIKAIQSFAELLLREAERLTAARRFDEAFAYYRRLERDHSDLPGWADSFHKFLYIEAVALLRNDQILEALTAAEELYQQAPEFVYRPSAPTPVALVGTLLERLADSYIQQGKYLALRTILQRISESYGDERPAAIDSIYERLAEMAAAKREQARDALAAGAYRDATGNVKEMMRIWPDVPGGRAIDAELSAQYPLIVVGVMQPLVAAEVEPMFDWAARRTRPLIRPRLVEFLGPGSEGGQYECPFGLIELSIDRRQLTLRLSEEAADGNMTGYEICRQLFRLADPASVPYDPAWGSLMAAATLPRVNEVRIELRRPHVLPAALLQVPLPQAHDGGLCAGPFRMGGHTESETQFLFEEFRPGGRLAEVVERRFQDPVAAWAALKNGTIDVIDRLFPADAARLRGALPDDGPIAMEPYALPTLHMLLVNQRNPFLANRDFRRALLFGINRAAILQQELLGNRELAGCRLISGPFPAGDAGRDPLAYAYDERIEPRPYTPQLAKLLKIVAADAVQTGAEQRGTSAPAWQPLVLGHPATEVARVASQAIASQLRAIEIDCTLKEFPPGIVFDGDDRVDLTYAEVAIWEPLVDARRLLGERGPVTRSPYVDHALRSLDLAQNWIEVRDQLLQVHRIVHNELPVLPLWQTANYLAYRTRLKNIGERPVTLYQHIHQWRLGSTEPSGRAAEP